MITYSQDYDIITNNKNLIESVFYHVFKYTCKNKKLTKFYASNVFNKKQAYMHFKKMLNYYLLKIDN